MHTPSVHVIPKKTTIIHVIEATLLFRWCCETLAVLVCNANYGNKMFTCFFTLILDSLVALFWKSCKHEKKNEVIKASKVCQITTTGIYELWVCAYDAIVMQLTISFFLFFTIRYEDILTILKIKFFPCTFTYKVTLLEPKADIVLSHLSSNCCAKAQ